MIRPTRRLAMHGLAALALQPHAANAQAWPARPIRILVGYSAGGAVDTVARAVAQQLQAGLGQPVLVDNRPGAGTNIALRALIDSPPDGSTLALTAAEAQAVADAVAPRARATSAAAEHLRRHAATPAQ